jgi:hypothetical protein
MRFQDPREHQEIDARKTIQEIPCHANVRLQTFSGKWKRPFPEASGAQIMPDRFEILDSNFFSPFENRRTKIVTRPFAGCEAYEIISQTEERTR